LTTIFDVVYKKPKRLTKFTYLPTQSLTLKDVCFVLFRKTN